MNQQIKSEIDQLRARAKWWRDQAKSKREWADHQDGRGAAQRGYDEAAKYIAEAKALEQQADDLEAMAP